MSAPIARRGGGATNVSSGLIVAPSDGCSIVVAVARADACPIKSVVSPMRSCAAAPSSASRARAGARINRARHADDAAHDVRTTARPHGDDVDRVERVTDDDER